MVKLSSQSGGGAFVPLPSPSIATGHGVQPPTLCPVFNFLLISDNMPLNKCKIEVLSVVHAFIPW